MHNLLFISQTGTHAELLVSDPRGVKLSTPVSLALCIESRVSHVCLHERYIDCGPTPQLLLIVEQKASLGSPSAGWITV